MASRGKHFEALRHRGVVVALAASTACATYNEYTCPKPIGKIIRDDCAVYETQYDALSVDLGFSFKGVGVSAKVSQDKLRDASELVQVLKHQSLSLCRDFNSCRLPTPDYQKRRDRIDRTFTAVTALSKQLESNNLTEAQRAGLIESLVAVLSGKTPAAEPAKPRSTKRADPFYIPRPAKMAPASTQIAKGVPRVDDVEAYPRHPGYPKIDGLSFDLGRFALSDIQNDDVFEIDLGDKTIACEVKRDERRGGRARCKIEGDVPATVTLFYTPGATGQRAEIGRIDLDPARLVETAWVAYETLVAEDDTERFERPHVVIHSSERRTPIVFARCTVGGKPVGGAIRAERSQRAFCGERHAIELPFAVKTEPGPGSMSDEFKPSKHSGKWACRFSFDGAVRQIVQFTIDDQGRVAGPRRPKTSAWAPRWFAVPTEPAKK